MKEEFLELLKEEIKDVFEPTENKEVGRVIYRKLTLKRLIICIKRE